LKDTLFEYVFRSKVDTTCIPCISQDGRQRTSETELVIAIFEQDETGIGRQAATIEVEFHSFAPNRCKEQGWRLTLGRERRLHRIGV
jgi:hypothetical protein